MSLQSEPEEVFVLKTERKSETKTVSVEIHDFIQRIDDEKNKKNAICSPMFYIGGYRFGVDVYPHPPYDGSEEYIAIYLNNSQEVDILGQGITASFTIKHASGVEQTFDKQELRQESRGTLEFLSHAAYKEWTEDHGDVFRVEVKVTLHVEKGKWTKRGVRCLISFWH